MITKELSFYLFNLYRFTWVYLLSFPILYYLFCKYIEKKWIVQNLIILVSIIISYLLFIEKTDKIILVSFATTWAGLNIYLSIYSLIQNKRLIWQILWDILFIPSALWLITYITVKTGGFQIENTLEPYTENTYIITTLGVKNTMIEYITRTSIAIFIAKYLFYMVKYAYSFTWKKIEKRRMETEIRYNQLQNQLVQSQLEALQAKVNPHFLYNSLNSIAGLALTDGEKTKQMALALSRFFRYSMDKKQENLIELEKEIEIIQTYLEIEKIRFGEMLETDFSIEKNTRTYKIPPMTLLPLIENSIKHGMKGISHPIRIDIQTTLANNQLIISIKDNGTPFSDDFIPGYGLKSIYDKLELLFPGKHTIEILKHPQKEIRIILFYNT